MEILAFLATVLLSVYVEAFGARWNLTGIGAIFAAALMGAIILWQIRRKTK